MVIFKFDHQIRTMRIEVNEHLFLEVVAAKHTEAIFNMVDTNRTYLQNWMPWVAHTHAIEDIARFIAEAQAQFKANNGFNAAVFYNNIICGVIGLHNVDWLNRSTEIGYWLAESSQGKGIMTHCCRAIIDHCFNQMDLHRIEIKCGISNYKSQAIPQRLGFTQEGILKDSELLNGELVDHILYALLRHKNIEQHFI